MCVLSSKRCGGLTGLVDDVMFPLAEVWNHSVSQAPELVLLLEAFINVQVQHTVLPLSLH
jgi:hypothetical protein